MTVFDALFDELKRSKQIVSDGHEVVPRFRIMGPEGQFVMFVEHPDYTRAPDAITSLAVTRSGCGGFMHRIKRGRVITFGDAEEFGAQNFGDDLLALLPKRESAIARYVSKHRERHFSFGILI